MILTNLHLIFLFYLFKAVLLQFTADSNKDSSENLVPCEEGWYFFDEQCYKAGPSEEEVPWRTASLQCKKLGGTLVSIHSKEQNDFLTSIVLGHSPLSPWIGLVDQDDINLKTKQKQADLSWEDGSSFDYQNWIKGEPSPIHLHGYEGCVELSLSSHVNLLGKWNDASCDHRRSYICQKPSNKSLETKDERFCSAYDGGGWKFRGTCFQIYMKPTSWDDAQKYCENLSGNLVTIPDYKAELFLNYILSDFDNPYWIGIKVNKTQLKWNSQWHVSYNHFVQSLEDLPEGTCILKEKETRWISTPCTEKHAFICEISNAPTPVLPTVEGVSCPKEDPEWTDLGGEFCYYFNIKRSVSWYSALRECGKRGGTLAKILSKEQEQIFQKLLQHKVQFLHIGLTSIPSNGREFVWTDLSRLNLTHWAPGEPNMQSEKCGQLYTINMDWRDIDCKSKSGYICEVKKSAPKQKLQVTEVGQIDILNLYPNMQNLIGAALLILSENSSKAYRMN